MASLTDHGIQQRQKIGFGYWCFSLGILFTGILTLSPWYDPRIPLLAGFGVGVLGAAIVALANAMADTAKKIRDLEGSDDVSQPTK